MTLPDTLRCADADALLDAFAENALEDADRRAVAAHVAGCARCAREIERSRGVGTALAARQSSAPSPSLDARVLAAVDEERLWTATRARWRRRAAMATAGGVLAAAGVAAFALSPAAEWAGNRALDLVRAGSLWLRWRAIPAIEGSVGALTVVLAVLVVIAVTERIASASRLSRRA